jgi:hypothetical protein
MRLRPERTAVTVSEGARPAQVFRTADGTRSSSTPPVLRAVGEESSQDVDARAAASA